MQIRTEPFIKLALGIFSCCLFSGVGLSNAAQATPKPQDKQLTDSQRSKILFKKASGAGIRFLLEKGQAKDGSFSKQFSPAITGLCTSALIRHRVPLTHPRIQKALEFIESNIRKDGGVYAEGSNLRNYETSVAIMCFKEANEGGKYDRTIERAVGFLKGIQWDDGEGHTTQSSFFGGQGYGNHKRPDASNTSFYQDALKAVGEDSESASFQNAAIFMARCQNLSTQHNTAGWAAKATAEDSGGFIYTGVGAGESKAGETPEGGLRSYASMTYAGLKSMLYAGVDQNDIRVRAAMDWIGRHYDLTTNPGMGKQGLFYYYHVFAKTLDVAGTDAIVDSDGKSHNWRADLIVQLESLQREDGSWTNTADRWEEGDPNLVTAYSLLALSYCDEKPVTNQADNQKLPAPVGQKK
ncbi:MAG: terpene cyclase/mutase family protein [Mariniblastus sp.]|nr:terpene cyclase/mutase family protein [Mariniblastus sp.]